MGEGKGLPGLLAFFLPRCRQNPSPGQKKRRNTEDAVGPPFRWEVCECNKGGKKKKGEEGESGLMYFPHPVHGKEQKGGEKGSGLVHKEGVNLNRMREGKKGGKGDLVT